MARKVSVVAHTHWDREWYQPFEHFRRRLTGVLDMLLSRLDTDPDAEPFLLDGQLALVEDYLEVRPDAAAVVARLASSGRVSIGPWYVMADEFLVSGETLVRNLQRGIDGAAGLGGTAMIGYLPDMFGHVAQMPQILRQAGMEHAVVWRGVPAAIDRTGFWWRSPDGSTVRAEYLPVGYGIGAHLPADPSSLVRRMRAEEAELAAFLPDPDDPILLLSGSDHQVPHGGLAALVAAANAEQGDFDFEVTSLAAHLATARRDLLPEWEGELRSGARANLLMGVVSNRVDVRVAAARAERSLEGRAEPLSALWCPWAWPQASLDLAWREVLRNAAHDSVCACSSDEVGLAVLHRYAEATAVGDTLAAEALGAAADALGEGPVILNPTARVRRGLVELVLPGQAPLPGVQVLAAAAAEGCERRGRGEDLGRILGELTAEGWLCDGRASEVAVRWTGEGVELDLVVDPAARRPDDRSSRGAAPTPVGPAPAGAATAASDMAEAWAQAGANRHRPLRVRVQRRAAQHVAVRSGRVPGFGWAAWQADELDVAPVRGSDSWLDNGLVRLAVNPSDGSFSVNGLAGLGRLVEDGDAGDTYNYSPPAVDVVVERPTSVRYEADEAGPLRGRIRVWRTFRWPAELRGDRRIGSEDVEVLTDLELRAGEVAVRMTTTFDNRCRDHRLRAWFPLPHQASSSVAECAFATVERPLRAEGGPGERALATYPSRRFVTAGDLTVTHEGVAEHQLVDDGWALAVTLLRATGVLSRPAPTFRPNAAGPPLAVEGPQMIGRVTSKMAVGVGVGDPYRLADEVWAPLEVVNGRCADPGIEPVGSRLVVTGAEVSSLRLVGDRVELRAFNPSPDPVVVGIPGRTGWTVDLRGRTLEVWAGSFVLRAWGVATVRVDP